MPEKKRRRVEDEDLGAVVVVLVEGRAEMGKVLPAPPRPERM